VSLEVTSTSSDGDLQSRSEGGKVFKIIGTETRTAL